MTVPPGEVRDEPRTVPSANPRVVAYVLLNAGAILAAIGLAVLTHRVGWALVVLGLVWAVEGVTLVDVARGSPRPARPARPVRATAPTGTPRLRFTQADPGSPLPSPGPAGDPTRG